MRKLSVSVLFGCLLSLAIMRFGNIGTDTVDLNLPIKAEGFHCVFVRQLGQTLSLDQAVVIGSQDIENEVEEGGGQYKVYWSDVDDEDVPAKYREVVRAMIEDFDLPSWCLCDSGTGLFVIESVPKGDNSVDDALAKIRHIRGAR